VSYNVHIHPAAERDFGDQFNYIAERSFEGALRWGNAFAAIKTRLASNPLIYGSAIEEPWLLRGIRSAPFKTPQGNTYFAVYVVDGNEVTILRIRGEGQPPLGAGDVPNG